MYVGQSPYLIAKPSISIRAIYTMALQQITRGLPEGYQRGVTRGLPEGGYQRVTRGLPEGYQRVNVKRICPG